MKILCFSDSHGDDRGMKYALARHPDAEIVFHLGDGISEVELLAPHDTRRHWLYVRGNCDPSTTILPDNLVKTGEITLLGHKIVYTHGDLYGVKYGMDGLTDLAVSRCADLVLFGHTHTPYERYTALPDGRQAYFFNPGSVYRDYFSNISYGVITLTDSGILLSHGTAF